MSNEYKSKPKLTKTVKVSVKFSKDKTPSYNMVKKIEKLREKNVDRYGVFQCPLNCKMKCNITQVCNVIQLETYVCFDKSKTKDSDMFYTDYNCFGNGFMAAKLAISCKWKKNKVYLDSVFFDELSYIFSELSQSVSEYSSKFFVNEIKFLQKIFKKEDYENASGNIVYKDKSFTILVDISKEFATLFAKYYSVKYSEN